MQLPKQNLSPKSNTNWTGVVRYGEREQKSSEKLVLQVWWSFGGNCRENFFSRESF